jgi:type VI secretion system secreted protein Hcp
MSQPSYVKVTGATQGDISKGAFTADSVGNIYQEGHEDELFCQSVSYEISLPRDPQSGQVTGQRVHQPARILKYVDKASPMLMQALASGETLQFEASFYRTSTMGKQEKYYTVKFTDAILVHYRQNTPNPLEAINSAFRDMEELAFTYRKLDVTHDIAGTSGSDDWRAPKA